MSMQGDAGAKAAASELLALVEQKISENKDNPDVLKALRPIKKKAEEIIDAANRGWY